MTIATQPQPKENQMSTDLNLEPVTKATCICCRNLGVLPDSGTREVYDATSGQMVPVAPGQTVAGDVVLQMCDECGIAAFLSNGQAPHPHRMSKTLRTRRQAGGQPR